MLDVQGFIHQVAFARHVVVFVVLCGNGMETGQEDIDGGSPEENRASTERESCTEVDAHIRMENEEVILKAVSVKREYELDFDQLILYSNEHLPTENARQEGRNVIDCLDARIKEEIARVEESFEASDESNLVFLIPKELVPSPNGKEKDDGNGAVLRGKTGFENKGLHVESLKIERELEEVKCIVDNEKNKQDQSKCAAHTELVNYTAGELSAEKLVSGCEKSRDEIGDVKCLKITTIVVEMDVECEEKSTTEIVEKILERNKQEKQNKGPRDIEMALEDQQGDVDIGMVFEDEQVELRESVGKQGEDTKCETSDEDSSRLLFELQIMEGSKSLTEPKRVNIGGYEVELNLNTERQSIVQMERFEIEGIKGATKQDEINQGDSRGFEASLNTEQQNTVQILDSQCTEREIEGDIELCVNKGDRRVQSSAGCRDPQSETDLTSLVSQIKDMPRASEGEKFVNESCADKVRDIGRLRSGNECHSQLTEEAREVEMVLEFREGIFELEKNFKSKQDDAVRLEDNKPDELTEVDKGTLKLETDGSSNVDLISLLKYSGDVKEVSHGWNKLEKHSDQHIFGSASDDVGDNVERMGLVETVSLIDESKSPCSVEKEPWGLCRKESYANISSPHDIFQAEVRDPKDSMDYGELADGVLGGHRLMTGEADSDQSFEFDDVCLSGTASEMTEILSVLKRHPYEMDNVQQEDNDNEISLGDGLKNVEIPEEDELEMQPFGREGCKLEIEEVLIESVNDKEKGNEGAEHEVEALLEIVKGLNNETEREINVNGWEMQKTTVIEEGIDGNEGETERENVKGSRNEEKDTSLSEIVSVEENHCLEEDTELVLSSSENMQREQGKEENPYENKAEVEFSSEEVENTENKDLACEILGTTDTVNEIEMGVKGDNTENKDLACEILGTTDTVNEIEIGVKGDNTENKDLACEILGTTDTVNEIEMGVKGDNTENKDLTCEIQDTTDTVNEIEMGVTGDNTENKDLACEILGTTDTVNEIEMGVKGDNTENKDIICGIQGTTDTMNEIEMGVKGDNTENKDLACEIQGTTDTVNEIEMGVKGDNTENKDLACEIQGTTDTVNEIEMGVKGDNTENKDLTCEIQDTTDTVNEIEMGVKGDNTENKDLACEIQGTTDTVNEIEMGVKGANTENKDLACEILGTTDTMNEIEMGVKGDNTENKDIICGIQGTTDTMNEIEMGVKGDNTENKDIICGIQGTTDTVNEIEMGVRGDNTENKDLACEIQGTTDTVNEIEMGVKGDNTENKDIICGIQGTTDTVNEIEMGVKGDNTENKDLACEIQGTTDTVNEIEMGVEERNEEDIENGVIRKEGMIEEGIRVYEDEDKELPSKECTFEEICEKENTRAEVNVEKKIQIRIVIEDFDEIKESLCVPGKEHKKERNNKTENAKKNGDITNVPMYSEQSEELCISDSESLNTENLKQPGFEIESAETKDCKAQESDESCNIETSPAVYIKSRMHTSDERNMDGVRYNTADQDPVEVVVASLGCEEKESKEGTVLGDDRNLWSAAVEHVLEIHYDDSDENDVKGEIESIEVDDDRVESEGGERKYLDNNVSPGIAIGDDNKESSIPLGRLDIKMREDQVGENDMLIDNEEVASLETLQQQREHNQLENMEMQENRAETDIQMVCNPAVNDDGEVMVDGKEYPGLEENYPQNEIQGILEHLSVEKSNKIERELEFEMAGLEVTSDGESVSTVENVKQSDVPEELENNEMGENQGQNDSHGQCESDSVERFECSPIDNAHLTKEEDARRDEVEEIEMGESEEETQMECSSDKGDFQFGSVESMQQTAEVASEAYKVEKNCTESQYEIGVSKEESTGTFAVDGALQIVPEHGGEFDFVAQGVTDVPEKKIEEKEELVKDRDNNLLSTIEDQEEVVSVPDMDEVDRPSTSTRPQEMVPENDNEPHTHSEIEAETEGDNELEIGKRECKLPEEETVLQDEAGVIMKEDAKLEARNTFCSSIEIRFKTRETQFQQPEFVKKDDLKICDEEDLLWDTNLSGEEQFRETDVEIQECDKKGRRKEDKKLGDEGAMGDMRTESRSKSKEVEFEEFDADLSEIQCTIESKYWPNKRGGVELDGKESTSIQEVQSVEEYISLAVFDKEELENEPPRSKVERLYEDNEPVIGATILNRAVHIEFSFQENEIDHELEDNGKKLDDRKLEIGIDKPSTENESEIKQEERERGGKTACLGAQNRENEQYYNNEVQPQQIEADSVDKNNVERDVKLESTENLESQGIEVKEEDAAKEVRAKKASKIRSFEMLVYLETIAKELETFRVAQDKLKNSFRQCIAEVITNISSLSEAVEFFEVKTNAQIQECHEKLGKRVNKLEGDVTSKVSTKTLLRSYSFTQNQFGALKQRVKDLEQLCTSIRISELREEISREVFTEVNSLMQRVDITSSDVGDLKQRVRELEEECSSIRGKLADYSRNEMKDVPNKCQAVLGMGAETKVSSQGPSECGTCYQQDGDEFVFNDTTWKGESRLSFQDKQEKPKMGLHEQLVEPIVVKQAEQEIMLTGFGGLSFIEIEERGMQNNSLSNTLGYEEVAFKGHPEMSVPEFVQSLEFPPLTPYTDTTLISHPSSVSPSFLRQPKPDLPVPPEYVITSSVLQHQQPPVPSKKMPHLLIPLITLTSPPQPQSQPSSPLVRLSPSAETPGRCSILILTDSMLRGVQQHKLIPGVLVSKHCVDAGMKEMIKHVERMSVKMDYNCAVIHTGTNDVSDDVSDEEFYDMQLRIIDSVRRKYPRAHIVMSSLILHRTDRTKNTKIMRLNQSTENFCTRNQEMSYMDNNSVVMTAGGLIDHTLYFDDLHLNNTTGIAKLTSNLRRVLLKHLSQENTGLDDPPGLSDDKPTETRTEGQKAPPGAAANPSPTRGPTGLRIHEYNALYDWLESCKLAIYIDNFVRAGFDMISVTGLTPEDLTAIKIMKTGHRKKLLSDSAKRKRLQPQPSAFPVEKPVDIMTWLKLIGFQQYIPQFIDGGFDDMDFVQDLAIEDLDSIGITKTGHQRKLWMAVNALKSTEPSDGNDVILRTLTTGSTSSGASRGSREVTNGREQWGYMETDLDEVEKNRRVASVHNDSQSVNEQQTTPSSLPSERTTELQWEEEEQEDEGPDLDTLLSRLPPDCAASYSENVIKTEPIATVTVGEPVRPKQPVAVVQEVKGVETDPRSISQAEKGMLDQDVLEVSVPPLDTVEKVTHSYPIKQNTRIQYDVQRSTSVESTPSVHGILGEQNLESIPALEDTAPNTEASPPVHSPKRHPSTSESDLHDSIIHHLSKKEVMFPVLTPAIHSSTVESSSFSTVTSEEHTRTVTSPHREDASRSPGGMEAGSAVGPAATSTPVRRGPGSVGLEEKVFSMSIESNSRAKRPAPPVKPKSLKKPTPRIPPKPFGLRGKAKSFSGQTEQSLQSEIVVDHGLRVEADSLQRRYSTGSKPKKVPPPTPPKTRRRSTQSRGSSSSEEAVESVIEELEKRRRGYEERRKSFESLQRKYSDPTNYARPYISPRHGSQRDENKSRPEDEKDLNQQIKQVFRRPSLEDLLGAADNSQTSSFGSEITAEQNDAAVTDKDMQQDVNCTENLFKDINNMLSDFSSELDSMFDNEQAKTSVSSS